MNLFNVLDGAGYCTDVINGGIPTGIGGLVSLAVKAIQIVVPVLLIIWGMLDFAKAIIGQDEDKIKSAQKVFVKRLIAALVVFLIVTIVQLAIRLAASVGGDGNDAENAWRCAYSLISGRP